MAGGVREMTKLELIQDLAEFPDDALVEIIQGQKAILVHDGEKLIYLGRIDIE